MLHTEKLRARAAGQKLPNPFRLQKVSSQDQQALPLAQSCHHETLDRGAKVIMVQPPGNGTSHTLQSHVGWSSFLSLHWPFRCPREPHRLTLPRA
jgi:hypothetical protein